MVAREHDLAAENEALRQENASLRQEVAALSSKIAELEARLGQSSRNSSLPPSSDSPKSRAERRAAERQAAKTKRGETKRSRGKQPGAPGVTLMQRIEPDEIVMHEPEHCDSCGKDLTGARVEDEVSRQVFDTANPVLVCTEQVESQRVVCEPVSRGRPSPTRDSHRVNLKKKLRTNS